MYTSEFKKQVTTRLEKVFYGKEREAIGKIEGKIEKAEEIAMKLPPKNNLVLIEIAEITGLTVHQIKMLQRVTSALN